MSKKPDFTVSVKTGEDENGKGYYTRVGAAWMNEHEGKKFVNIKLDFPVGVTELTLFENTGDSK